MKQMTSSEYKKYVKMANEMNAVPMKYRNRKDPKRFDSVDLCSKTIMEVFDDIMSIVDFSKMYENRKIGKVQRLDSITLDETYYTEEGYLIDHPVVTTCGIFEYPQEDGSIRRELRLPEDVFSEKSLKSYKGKPIIITNVRREQIGTIMSEGYRDGNDVRCEIIIHDTNALKQCGLKELSLGYSLDTDEHSGVYQGEKYDCIQRNIEINHLALVGEARAGKAARLNIDSKDDEVQILKGGKATMKDVKTTGYVTEDGTELSPEELEAAVALFKAQQAANLAGEEKTDEDDAPGTESKTEKPLVDQIRANMDRIDAEGENMKPEDIIAAQKADLDKLLEEVDRLQAANDMNHDDESARPAGAGDDESTDKKVINADSVEKIIADRMDIYRMAEKLNLDGVENLPVSEGRKQIIKAVNPKMNLDGKSESYINAAYDIAKQSFMERKNTDAQRRTMMRKQLNEDSREKSNSASAREKMISSMIGGKMV